MSTATVLGVVRQLGMAEADPESDAALLTRYRRHADHAAFAELLRRHGPVVFGACRRVLNDVHDAEDAFQATFLVLAVKASSVRPPGAVGGWLYGVAVNVARKAKVAAARRWRREMATILASSERQSTVSGPDHADLRAIIDEELARLPATLRDAVVLCDLNERTRSEAARELGCPEGTIAARLHRARKLLAERLTRRGVTLPAAGLSALLTPEAVSAELARSTLAATTSFVAGAASTLVSPTVRTLAEGMMRNMSTGKLKLALAALAVGLLTGGGLLWGADRMEDPSSATAPVTSDQQALALDPPVKPEPIPGYVTDIRFSPDGKLFATVAGGKVTVSVTDFKPEFGFGPVRMTMPGEAVAFSADGTTLIVMGPKEVTSHDIRTTAAKSFPRPKTNLGWHQVAFTPDGKRYAAHFGFNVRVYDTATGFEPVRLDAQYEPGSSALPATVGKQIIFSPDGKKLAAVGVLVGEGKMGAAVWDAETGKRLHAIEADFTDGPRAIAFSPDSKVIAIGGNKRVVLYDAAAKEIRKLGDTPGSGPVTSLAFSADGKRLAIGFQLPLLNGADKLPAIVGHKAEVQLIDLATGKELKRLDGFEGVSHMAATKVPVAVLAFSPNGKTLAAGTGYPNVTSLPDDAPKHGEVKVFPLDGKGADKKPAGLDGWEQIKTFDDHNDYVDGVAVGPDRQTFATAGGGTVIMWDANTRKHLWQYKVVNPGITAVAYTQDGLRLAVTHQNGVTLLNAVSGKVERAIAEKDANPSAVAFAPDALDASKPLPRRLAFTNGRVVWAKTWIPDNGPISTAQFGPLAGGGGVNPNSVPAGVAYSPDGERFVFIPNEKIDPAWNTSKNTGIPDPKKATHFYAQVWGGGSGKPMQFFLLGTDPVTAVAWSPDGKQVALGSSTGDVALFDAATAKELRRTHVGGRSGQSTIHALAFSPDSKVLAAALNFDEGKNVNRVVMFDAKTLDRGQDLQGFFKSPPVSVAFSPDGRTLLVGTGHKDPFDRDKPAKERVGEVQLWSLDKDGPNKPEKPEPQAAAPWREKAVLTDNKNTIISVAFSPDGKWLLAGGETGTGCEWHVASLERTALYTHDDQFTDPAAVAYSPDGLTHATTFRDGAYWHNRQGAIPPRTLQEKDSAPRAIAYGAYGDTANGKRFNRLAFTDGRTLWAKSWYDDAPVSTATFGPLEGDHGIEGAPPAGVAYSADGKQLVFLPNSKIDPDWISGKSKEKKEATHWFAQVWGGGSGAPMAVPPHGTEPVTAVVWSKDGKLIATGGADGNVILWDGKTFKEVRRVALGKGRVEALAFAADSKSFAAAFVHSEGENPNRVIVLNAATGTRSQELAAFKTDRPRAVAFAPDGKLLAVGCGNSVRVFTTEPAP